MRRTAPTPPERLAAVHCNQGTLSQQNLSKPIPVATLLALQSPFFRAGRTPSPTSKPQDLRDALAFTLARRPNILGLHWRTAHRLSHLADRLLQKLGFAPEPAIFTTVSKKVFIHMPESFPLKKHCGRAEEAWRISANSGGERKDKHCVFWEGYLVLLHHPVFYRGKNCPGTFCMKSKAKVVSNGEELNLAGKSLSFSTASPSMLAGSTIQKTNSLNS